MKNTPDLTQMTRRRLLFAGSAVVATLGASAIPRQAAAQTAGDWVSVKDFGAVGDGITDDSAAIQSALNSGNSIYFGGLENNYRVSSVVSIPSNTYLMATGATVTLTRIEAFVCSSATNIHIEGFRFDGEGTNYRVIHFDGCNDIRILDNHFGNMGNKLGNGGDNSFIRFDSSSDITVSGNTFRDSNLSFIFLHTTCRDVTFSNNAAINCSYPDPENYGLGVHVDMLEMPGGLAKNIVITGNRVTNCGFLCHVNGCHGLTVSGNHVQRCQNGMVMGIPDDASLRSSSVTISGNSVVDARDEAMTIRGCDTLVISDNAIDGCEFGISTRECDQISVSGNAISNVTSIGVGSSNGQGIGIRDCHNGTISDNTIDVFTHYGIVLLYDCSSLNISSNHIRNAIDASNNRYGVYLNSVSSSAGFSDIRIYGNRIFDVYHGIDCRSGQRVNIQNNSIDAEKFGIKLNSLDGLSMSTVNITGNQIGSTIAAYSIRIDDGGGQTDDISIVGNQLQGVNNIRIAYSGTGLIQNNKLSSGVVFTAIDLWKEGVDLLPFTQRVTNSVVALDTLATLVLVDYTQNWPATIQLKNPLPGRKLTIKDSGGNAGINNITLDGQGYTIDGASSLVMATNSESIQLYFYDGAWHVV